MHFYFYFSTYGNRVQVNRLVALDGQLNGVLVLYVNRFFWVFDDGLLVWCWCTDVWFVFDGMNYEEVVFCWWIGTQWRIGVDDVWRFCGCCSIVLSAFLWLFSAVWGVKFQGVVQDWVSGMIRFGLCWFDYWSFGNLAGNLAKYFFLYLMFWWCSSSCLGYQ